MNPVFWFLVLIGTFVVWVLSRPFWEPFGKWIVKRHNKINETLNKEEKEERVEDFK